MSTIPALTGRPGINKITKAATAVPLVLHAIKMFSKYLTSLIKDTL